MRKVVHDYYSGFEGEPEITFVRKDTLGDELAFALWDGHFGRIIELIQPEPEGWSGLALHYHLDTGWNEDDDWRVPDPEVALSQLDGLVRADLPEQERKILDELVAFIREGIQAGDALHIQYF